MGRRRKSKKLLPKIGDFPKIGKLPSVPKLPEHRGKLGVPKKKK